MKTKTPADPAKLRKFVHAMERIARHGDSLAKHAQLRLAILNTIHAGHWAAGDRLPPETGFTVAPGLSMGTVQRALRDLTERAQDEGLGATLAPAKLPDYQPRGGK